MTSFFVAIFGHRSLLAAGEEVYEGLKLHKTGGWHAVVGKGIASVMWCVENVARPHLLLLTSSCFLSLRLDICICRRFWIFYRFYHDYDSFLVG